MRFGMLLLVSTGTRFGASGFQVASRSVAKGATTNKATTQLFANNFMAEIQKSLSTIATGPNKPKYYTIGITGAGGLVGSALRDELRQRDTVNGKAVRVVRLSRGSSAQAKDLSDDIAADVSLKWNPYGSTANDIIDPSVASQLDAVVHLAGENVATGQGPLGFLGIRPWTDEKKAEILASRTVPTAALAQVLANTKRPQTLLAASGVGVYGDNYFVGDEQGAVDESMDVSRTQGFLADVSREWEGATAAAVKGGNRVVNLRFGVVLSKKGGALAKLYPIFFLGGGGNVGSGKQYFSFVSARDIARGIVHSLETSSLKGPVNVCAPEPTTNAGFTQALGKVLGRPTILPLPGFAVSLLFGQMGEEMLLGGVRALPGKLVKSGFEFQHPTIEKALQSAMKEDI